MGAVRVARRGRLSTAADSTGRRKLVLLWRAGKAVM
jgi:hypothetical protein